MYGKKMTSPVRCSHCGQIYDLGTVKVEARYSDCSVWKSPCCNRTVDDRTWKSFPDFKSVSQDEIDRDKDKYLPKELRRFKKW